MGVFNEAPRLKAALSLAELDLKVFPLVPNGKIPLIKEWQRNGVPSPQQIQLWWTRFPKANIGIQTGDGLVVLDVDVKNNAGGMESLKRIFSADDMKPFRIVHTPTGGIHIYFHTDEPFRNRAGFMPGLDIRGEGGYVVGPWSVIGDKEYIKEENDGGIMEMPEKLAEILRERPSKVREKNQQLQLVEDYEVRKLDLDKLREDPAAMPMVKEGQRNNTLFKLACRAYKSGMEESECEAFIFKINDTRLDEPLDEDEIFGLLESALQYVEVAGDNAEDVPEWQRVIHPDHFSFLQKYSYDEIGSADLLIAIHNQKLRYIPEFHQFAWWTGLRWEMDITLQIERARKELASIWRNEARRLRTEAKKLRENGKTNLDNIFAGILETHVDIFSRQASRAGTHAGMQAITKVAQSDIVLNQCQLNQDDYLFGTLNGVVDLKNGIFTENPDKDWYMTMQGRVHYDPSAECPRWMKFLDQVMEGDEEMLMYLQKLVGYALTGDCSEQCLYFLFGHGANGKSTFMNVISEMLGDYSAQVQSELLMARNNANASGPTPELARLSGVRLVSSTELEEGERLGESLVKSLTGQDPIVCRHLHKDFFEFIPKFKLVMVGNHRPHVRGTDHGIWRRMRMLGFNATIPENQRDPHLQNKLMQELSGIFNWALRGCIAWQADGLGMTAKVCEQTDEYKKDEDIVEAFFEDCCVVDFNGDFWISLQDLYRHYAEWARESNEWKMKKRALSGLLKEKGFIMSRRSEGMAVQGIDLTDPHRFLH